MFFRTDEGRPHIGRICGLLYLVGFTPQCIEFRDPYCFAGLTFIAGWWLCFGAKQAKRSYREMLHPIGIIGLILIVLGLAGQFYFVRRR